MISKINLCSADKKHTPTGANASQPEFCGIGDYAAKCGKKITDKGINLLQKCEKHPMINVAVLDLATAIIPRTLVETFAVPKEDKQFERQEDNEQPKEKPKRKLNILAGMEALRRESSGLIVNCLIPSAIVYSAARGIQKIAKPFKTANLSGVWADDNTIKKFTQYYNNAKGSGDEKLLNAFKELTYSLSGIDGKEEKAFAELLSKDDDFVFKKLVQAVNDETQGSKLVKEAYETVASKTHITENLKFKGEKNFHTINLEGIYSNMVKYLRNVVKEGATDNKGLTEFAQKAVKLVNWKSLGGLALIIPLAVSMQPINRWLTHKAAGQKGAPLTVDREYREPTRDEKSKLFKQKIISMGTMIGVGLLSMMKIPTLNMLQFKGKFPSMDQARLIATATFASRMYASEDPDDLREATLRDIATFTSFYFFGDFAAKAIASGIEAADKTHRVKLINTLKPLKENANFLEKAWHWIKHTTIKSSDELSTVKDKRLRTICQLGNLAFSLIALGIFIPLYNRTITNRKDQERKLRELANSNTETGIAAASASSGSILSEDLFKASIKHNPAFQSFFNS